MAFGFFGIQVTLRNIFMTTCFSAVREKLQSESKVPVFDTADAAVGYVGGDCHTLHQQRRANTAELSAGKHQTVLRTKSIETAGWIWTASDR